MTSSFTRFVILLSSVPGASRSVDLIRAHVQHLNDLDQNGKLVLAGPFTNFAGGMIIISASDLTEAQQIAARDPFVIQGVSSFEVRAMELSCEENNHLGMG